MYDLYYFKKINSTNDKIKDFEKEGIVVIAEQQTKGRGRFKRKWSSGKNGLWFSILLKPKNVEKLSFLNFCAAISCQKAIKKITRIKTKLKWPNDLIFANKKLCGILTESSLGKGNLVYIGIGINTNNKIPKDLEKIAISLYNIANKKIDNKKLLKNILDYFDVYYKKYQKEEYDEILEEWKKLSDTINRYVLVIIGNKKINGKVIDVDKEGNIVLKTKNNKKLIITQGDIVYW